MEPWHPVRAAIFLPHWPGVRSLASSLLMLTTLLVGREPIYLPQVLEIPAAEFGQKGAQKEKGALHAPSRLRDAV
jgi:hypothetical protein